MNNIKIKRNDRCNCGSELKYKKCCGIIKPLLLPQNMIHCDVNNFIHKFNTNDAQLTMFINQWMNDFEPFALCYIDNNIIIAFALMTKMHFDPLKKHKNPYCINYIYTIEKYRNTGYASKLLQFIKTNFQISAHISNDTSENLFIKNGYISHRNKTLMRYP